MECPICNGKGSLKDRSSKGYDYTEPAEEVCDFCCGRGFIATQDDSPDYHCSLE